MTFRCGSFKPAERTLHIACIEPRSPHTDGVDPDRTMPTRQKLCHEVLTA